MALALTLALHGGLAASAAEVPVPPSTSTVGPRLEWTAPRGCPEASRGAEQLARFLGGGAPSVPVRIELVQEASGYAATVEVDGAVRTLHGSDCHTVARAAALVVAVSLDPVAAAAAVLAERQGDRALDTGVPEREPPLGAPEPGPTTREPPLDPTQPGVPALEPTLEPIEPTPAPRLEPLAPDASRARRRPTSARADMPGRAPASAHSLGLGGGITRALLPALTGAVRLGHAFDRGAFRLQTEATYVTPRLLTYPDAPAVGGRFQSLTVGVRACFAPTAARVTVPLCAGVEGGPIFGRGIGVVDTRSPVDAWVGALGSGAAVVRVHPRLAVTAGAELVASLRRPAFHVGARETLFRAPLVGVRALAGLELRLR